MSQSACTDEDALLFQLPVLSDSSESFPFGELSLTKGARLVITRERKASKQVGAVTLLSDLVSVGDAFSLSVIH